MTEADKAALLDFQRAKFVFDVYSQEGILSKKAKDAYRETKEKLATITDPDIAKLVATMSQDWAYVETPDSRSIEVARAEEIMLAERELFALSFEYGDTIPSASTVY